MSHEAGLVDYFPSDIKRWVKSEDIGSDGVIECKRYAGVTGILDPPKVFVSAKRLFEQLMLALAQLALASSPMLSLFIYS